MTSGISDIPGKGLEAIELQDPPDGSVTSPLQQHQWPPLNTPASGLELESPSFSSFRWDNLEIVAADRSFPRPVRLVWGKVRRGWRSVRYELTLARSADLQDAPLMFKGLSRPEAEAWHLFIGTTYYWRVRAFSSGHLAAESPVFRFTTNSTPPRWIKVPGITNVRDIGGWPLPRGRRIRQGLVYRSSEMNGHLQISGPGRHVLEYELGIHTDLDLRGDYEGASPALDTEKVRWIHAPVSPYDCICDAAFRNEYLTIFRTFAHADNYPILFHCVGGADRGGTVAFLLNALLGKDREHLLLDYELTTLSVWGERSRWSDQFRSLVDVLRPFSKDPDNLREQVENYLLSIGLQSGEIKEIRRLLIE